MDFCKLLWLHFGMNPWFVGVLFKPMLVFYKVGGSETTHVRVGPPFPYTSLNGNILSLFSRQREIDEAFC